MAKKAIRSTDRQGPYSLSDVFGTSRGVSLIYRERAGIDAEFVYHLKHGKHIIVYGSSSQGKSSLVKRQLDPKQYILVQCSERMLRYDVYRLLLSEAGVYVSLGRKKKRARGVAANITLYTENTNSESETVEQSIQIDLSNVNDIIRILSDNNFTRTIVFNDFHLLRGKVKRQIAADLKLVYEKSRLQVIILGVWREVDKLSALSGDWTGRSNSVQVDRWSRDDLVAVVDAGCRLLNVTFSPELIDRILSRSMGNVGVLQQLCYRTCQGAGIDQTRDRPATLSDPDLAEQALSAVVEESAGRYVRFIEKFARWRRSRSVYNESGPDTQLRIPKWVMHCILSSDTEALARGLTLQEIHRHINNVIRSCKRDETFRYTDGKATSKILRIRPVRGGVDIDSVLSPLTKVERFQRTRNFLPMILSFEKRRGVLRVLDIGFLLFLESAVRQELLTALPNFDDEFDDAQLAAAALGRLDAYYVMSSNGRLVLSDAPVPDIKDDDDSDDDDSDDDNRDDDDSDDDDSDDDLAPEETPRGLPPP